MVEISVVIGAYNAADTIERSVVSILEQTLADLELIVVDDGSSDETPRLLATLAALDSRVRVVRTENGGLTRALVRGCGEARGLVIARQDADDWSEPDRLEAQLALLDSDPALGFVTCDVAWESPDGAPLGGVRSDASVQERTRALMDAHVGPPAHGSVMFRRELYLSCGGYRPEFYFAQDIDLWLRMGECALLGGVPRTLYHHVRDPDSISGAARTVQWEFGALARQCADRRTAKASEADILARAGKLAEAIRASGTGARSERDRALANYNLGVAMLEQGNREARKYLMRSVRLDPFHLKAWVRLLQLLFLRAGGRPGPVADRMPGDRP